MTPFTYDVLDVDTGREVALGGARHVEFLGGGTDLVPAMKLGLARPDHVVDLKRGTLDARIERTADGWRLGALATLADLQDHAELRAAIPALAESVEQAATRQIRNRATIAGNLLQRSRCGYYREPSVNCWLQGGSSCPARGGRNEHHAIFDTGPCITTQPSDAATVLVALDASVGIDHGGERINVPVEHLLQPPTADRRQLHRLEPGDVITDIVIPVAHAERSTYRKAMDRAAWQFALVGIAVVERSTGTAVVASGVAAVPWRLPRVEAVLVDGWTTADVDAAVAGAGDEATPFEENRYKLPLLRGLLRQALRDLAS